MTDGPPMVAPSFILFQGRILNTAHLITLAPPRPDGGKHIIEARAEGGVSYYEEYEDDEEAAGRYLTLAAQLLGDAGIAAGVQAGGGVRQGDGAPFRDLKSV